LEQVTPNGEKLSISVITYMEVLGYRFDSENEKQIIRKLCDLFPVIGLTQEIVNKVILIRQNHRIKLPDAIIMATAIITDQELVTANVSDFINIDSQLKIYNPLGVK